MWEDNLKIKDDGSKLQGFKKKCQKRKTKEAQKKIDNDDDDNNKKYKMEIKTIGKKEILTKTQSSMMIFPLGEGERGESWSYVKD